MNYRKFGKRILDITASILVLILLLPLFVIIYLILLFDLKENPLFIQERAGQNGKRFKLIKFRTMTNKMDQNGRLLPDTQRITKIGEILRKYSIDELPQFVNVLNGDMSIVGPRPLLVKYLPYYTKRQARRHEVKPGITGLAQVNGRNKLTWEEKFELDVYYVDSYNFLMDMKILILTLIKVLKREGINYSNDITMTPFNEVQK
ncbi:sugar transferase [Calditrichota bacterium GD2]